MAKDEVSIEWEGLQELQDLLKEMGDHADALLEEEYKKFAIEVESGARALAPRDTGDLEASINAGPVFVKNGEVSGEVGAGSNLSYAADQHENPNRPGARTQQKPSWKGYQPGRKFLENAMRGSEQSFDMMNVKILERILEGRKRF